MNFTDEKFDIVIQAGQSNAEGCGRGPLNEPAYIPDGDIMHLAPEFTATVATVNGVENLFVEYADKPVEIFVAKERGTEKEPIADFSLTFSGAYKAAGYLEKGRKILVIRAAIGGTGFMKRHWG